MVTYRVRSKQRFYTLGRHGELTVQQARARAMEVRAGAARGEDPSAERRGYLTSPRVRDLAERFMREHAAQKKSKSQTNYEPLWRVHVFPALGERRVADLTREDIARHEPPWASGSG